MNAPTAPPPPGGGVAEPPVLPPRGGAAGAAYPDDDWGFRCSICAVTWPADDPRLFGYPYEHEWDAHEIRNGETAVHCPRCQSDMRIFSNVVPMELQEAWSIVNNIRFDYYYARRGERDVLTREELDSYGE